ncbi:PR-1-like protein [Fomitiporia mediterranea MF3/22]|uniref:PR-1-like protein n=1 Tax=Fomitiporia mediterranea (strain MF3/22) TaxID=694068 RepID=UPI0004409A05|nr:PR-1-like protein [Fomitiporia mediterranea MF3/22]EJD04155.1 PR-1-like protein [Fomitiporia mediterranea MF3/22]
MLSKASTIALVFSVAPILSAFAAPPPCSGGSWGWPGFQKGNNKWGAVLYPSQSSSFGNGKEEDCVPSGFSAVAHSSVATSTSFSTTYKTFYTTTTTFGGGSSTTFKTTSTQTTKPASSSTFSQPSSSSGGGGSSSQQPTSQPSSSNSVPSSSSSKPPVTTSQPTSSSSSSAPTPTSSGGGSGSGTSNQDIQAYLNAHNNIRSQHGASPLSWNDTLAVAAQKWANGCVFQHSGGKVGPFGENLAAGSGDYGITSAITSWTNEASQYNPSNPTASHFTQVVWKGSSQLGCAVKTCAAGALFGANFGNSNMYVCEYFPEGNMLGDFAQNVQV